MSLIEEALRRQQEGASPKDAPPPVAPSLSLKPPETPPPVSKEAPPSVAPSLSLKPPETPPPVPPPVPEEPHGGSEEEQPERKLRMWLFVALVVLAVLLAGVAMAAYRYWKSSREWQSQTVVSQAPPSGGSNVTRKVAETTETERVGAAVDLKPPAAERPLVTAVTGSVAGWPATPLPPSGTGSEAAAQSADVLVLGNLTGRVARSSEAGGVRSVLSAPPLREEASARVVWPVLKVTGLLDGRQSGKGSAIINSRVVGVGESVDGVTIRKVTGTGVEFEYQGETRVVRVGESAE